MLIGTATSAHQVDGNNKSSDWWHFEQTGRLKHKSGASAMQYKLYKEDIRLMKRLGFNAYRFSIEFARIMPSRNKIDKRAIEHYKDVFRTLKKNDIEPIPTLWHYTLPMWFYKLGGFENRENFAFFIDYVDALLKEGVLDARYVLTINEPVIYASKAFAAGTYPPFNRSIIRFNKILNNVLSLHNEVYDVLKAYNYQISFTNNIFYFKSDAALYPVVLLLDYIFNQKPFLRTRFDFVGINYYKTIDAIKFIASRLFPSRKKIWFVGPQNLEKIIEREYRLFHKPVMITENGVDTLDERFRSKFIAEHFDAVIKAKRKGVPVIGYLHWSFIDNFEWNYGYNRNYGILGFDHKTERRVIKSSALTLSEIAKRYS